MPKTLLRIRMRVVAPLVWVLFLDWGELFGVFDVVDGELVGSVAGVPLGG